MTEDHCRCPGCGACSASQKLAKLKTENAAQRNEIARLRVDAECFRFWVQEAANNPVDMAKLIMRCTTEQEYLDVIMPLANAANAAIDAAMKGTK